VVAGAPAGKGSFELRLTKVSRKYGKVGSSWVLLSNGRDEFFSRIIRAWLGQGRRFLTLQ
jgi:histidinol-phosphate/aromatic aminotransferase/cobyric acid decarboxylase-like protein